METVLELEYYKLNLSNLFEIVLNTYRPKPVFFGAKQRQILLDELRFRKSCS